MPLAYWNGDFVPLSSIRLSPLDRGFLFGDGVYEMIACHDGLPFEAEAHYQRLQASMAAIGLSNGPDPVTLHAIVTRLMQDCRLSTGADRVAVYLQVTRGTAPARRHAFPPDGVLPNVFAMANPLALPDPLAVRTGFSAITAPDIRWQRCDIKTISLLGAVLAAEQAAAANALETILVRDGMITEASSSNVFVVSDGVIRTPRADTRILNGITRQVVLRLARARQLPVEETDLPLAALYRADEVWLTSTGKEIVPVIRVDDRPIGTGRPGPLWSLLRALFDQASGRPSLCPLTPTLQKVAS